MAAKPAYAESVFINCPFDEGYDRLFRAITFTVFDCGFVARCAREFDDGTEVRLEKIYRLIDQCKYAVHDLSKADLDRHTGLARFNMPLELGIFLGAKRFGKGPHERKSALILDVEAYRYQKFISDISGQDVKKHDNKPESTVAPIRDWLSTASGRVSVPGSEYIRSRLAAFTSKLPDMCREVNQLPHELTFNDLTLLMTKWLRLNAVPTPPLLP